MINLTRFETTEGIELVINTETGEAYATQAGYARMSGVSPSALSNRINRGYKGFTKADLKYSEILTPKGMQSVHLIPESIISDWIIDDNLTLAKAMLRAGVRLFMHHLAGYETKTIADKDSTPKSRITAEEIAAIAAAATEAAVKKAEEVAAKVAKEKIEEAAKEAAKDKESPMYLPLSTPEDKVPPGYIRCSDCWMHPDVLKEIKKQNELELLGDFSSYDADAIARQKLKAKEDLKRLGLIEPDQEDPEKE